MEDKKVWADFYLTERGWEKVRWGERGSEIQGQIPPPADAVLVVRRTLVRQSGESGIQIDGQAQMIWRAPDDDRIEALQAQHGRTPPHLVL